MNNIMKLLSFSLMVITLVACSPVKIPATSQYQLSAYSGKKVSNNKRSISLWVTTPEAVAGYQTEQMIYMDKPFQLSAFVKNAWANPPADMIYPLMIQSLQETNFFHAVMSSAYSQGADYRLDTQLLKLKQNFLKRPSVLELSVKVVLTRVENNQVIASKIIQEEVRCPADTPYGGVMAANQATRQLTARIDSFVVEHLR